MMCNWKKTIFYGALLAALFISSCGDWDFESTGSNRFAYELQGTWFSVDPSVYNGELIIGIDRITINDFNANQTQWWGNDNQRPFKDFDKEQPLKGYSKEGKIYIEKRGVLQEGIPYTYWANTLSKENFIYFDFDGREEAMKKR